MADRLAVLKTQHFIGFDLQAVGQPKQQVYDNGREFARSTFTVTTLGEAFVTGARGECTISNFPYSGENTTFEWNQNAQGLMVTEYDDGGSGDTGPGDQGGEYNALASGMCEGDSAIIYAVALDYSTEHSASTDAVDWCNSNCTNGSGSCSPPITLDV